MQDGKYHLAIALPPEASEEVQKNLARMPDRQIFDFLVHYFVTDVHWSVVAILQYMFGPPIEQAVAETLGLVGTRFLELFGTLG